ELLGVLARERAELDRRAAQPAGAPAGVDLEQLRPGEAEDEERRVAYPAREVIDQPEQRLLRPVDVLESQYERLRGGEALRPLARGPGDLLLTAVGLDGLEHAGGERQQVRDRLVLARRDQLLAGRRGRVVVGDARGGLDHLAERPVRDALPVRKRAPHEHRGALELGHEVAREPALADARLAVD